MATLEEVEDKVIDQIHQAAQGQTSSGPLLQLAEAIAWIKYPNQPHGGVAPQS